MSSNNSKSQRLHPALCRVDSQRLRVVNRYDIPATLFASEGVPVEAAAVDELLSVADLADTAERFGRSERSHFDVTPEVTRIAVTPDFHKGSGIPIGTVLATRGFLVPQAIGNDINCGMRLHTTSLRAEQIHPHLDVIESRARHLFFEGGRNIPMTRAQRSALFQEGVTGLLNAVPKSQTEGIWSRFHRTVAPGDLLKIHASGTFQTDRIWHLDDFLGPREGFSRDNQIGSIGGGNHFVEVQQVHKILDGATAHAWGIREGGVAIMVHSGSLSIGHRTGSHFRSHLREIFPAEIKHPDNGIFILPDSERHAASLELFWAAMSNAANFAFANRLFLGLLAMEAIAGAVGAFDSSLLYDAPHNLVWRETVEGQQVYLHRKGACPARDFSAMGGTPFEYFGEPVLIPGSMGASSFILAGRGNPEALFSASHGAGRMMSRGEALRSDDGAFREFLRNFQVVTPVDLRRPDIAMRRDIVEKKLEDIKKEAPFAYKGIGPVIQTVTQAQMARPVAELRPLMTIKG